MNRQIEWNDEWMNQVLTRITKSVYKKMAYLKLNKRNKKVFDD